MEMINFFNEFLYAEYSNNRARYDIEISDDAFLEYEIKVKSFFHSYVQSILGYNRVNEFEDQESINISKIKLDRQRRRILYMVRVYNQYELGANLRSKVKTGTELYRFFVSNDTTYEGNEQTYISNSYFAAETDEGFKIIGVAYYYDETWWHSRSEIYHIHPGAKATEIIRLEEPIDEDSKKIYYSEEEMPIIDSSR